MDRNGIGISILSLTQPGIEGVTDSRQAVELARKMNDHAARTIGRRSVGPTPGDCSGSLNERPVGARACFDLRRSVEST
jgi:hypothetical protein